MRTKVNHILGGLIKQSKPRSSQMSSSRPGFSTSFPREIRDRVLGHAVSDIPNITGHDEDECYSCPRTGRGGEIRVTSSSPPYLGGREDCNISANWLAAVSGASRQFASEIRPLFWQRWIFAIEEQYPDAWFEWLCNGGRGQEPPKYDAKFENFEAFVRNMGAEAKELRRLHLTVPCVFLEGDPDPTATIIGRVGEFLHDDLRILLQVVDEREDLGYSACWFERDGEERRVRVETLGDTGEKWDGWDG